MLRNVIMVVAIFNSICFFSIKNWCVEVFLSMFLLFFISSFCWILLNQGEKKNYFKKQFHEFIVEMIPILFLFCGGLVLSQSFDFDSYESWTDGYIGGAYSSFSKATFFLIVCTLLYASQEFFFYVNSGLSFIYKIHSDIVLDFMVIICLLSFFCSLLLSSWDLTMSYIVLEGISLSSIILMAHLFNKSSIEAAMKYLTFNIISSGFLLLGLFFIFANQVFYFSEASLNFSVVFMSLFKLHQFNILSLKLGVVLFSFGFFFKLAVFPVHTWLMDVYEGTWDLVMAFLSTGVKLVYFFFFIRILFNVFFFFVFDVLGYLFLLGAAGSLFFSSVGAMTQTRIKRMLAYTSMGQMGFVFLGLLVNSMASVSSSIFHLYSYILSLVLFFMLYFSMKSFTSFNLIFMSDFMGFGRVYPIMSLIFTLVFLSMGGLPPLVGFFTKYYIFLILFDKGYYLLTLYAILLSVLGSFVYLSLMKVIWFENSISVCDGFYNTFNKVSHNFNELYNKIFVLISFYSMYLMLFILLPDTYFVFFKLMCNSLVNPLIFKS